MWSVLLCPPLSPAHSTSQSGSHSGLHIQIHRLLLPGNQSGLRHRCNQGGGGDTVAVLRCLVASVRSRCPVTNYYITGEPL